MRQAESMPETMDSAFDLFDPRQTQALWKRAVDWRRDSPVLRLPSGHIYVSRWADCWEVLRDPHVFANGDGFKAVEIPEEERMLGEMDPPRHPSLRRIMRSSFDKRAVAAQRPFARREAQRLVGAWKPGDALDLVARYTDVISNLVSFHMMGFPLEDSDQIVDWVRHLLHSDWPVLNRTERGEGLAGAFPEFAAYLDGLVDVRRADPTRDDLVARLVQSRLEGAPLSPTVLRSLTAHVVLGGISTTTNLLANLLLRLLRDRELHARLRAEPTLLEAAVEESLRLDPPVLFVMRVCREKTQIAGFEIEPGESVLAGIASANRDEAIYDDPDEFKLDRGLPRHLSFSGGAHHCIGAGLARLVASESIGAFLERFDVDDVRLASDFVYEGVPVFLENGPVRLDVEILG